MNESTRNDGVVQKNTSAVNRVRFEGDISPECGEKYNTIPIDSVDNFMGQLEESEVSQPEHKEHVFLASQDSITSVTSINRLRVFKIIVIGDSGVGKTCLTFRFCGGEFRPDAEVTIGVDFRERILEVEGERIKIQLWDTAGQERFRRSMVQHYYRNTHAVVFVYDVTKMTSFEALPDWIAECNKFSLGCNVPRILVGNKCDCRSDQVVPTNLAQRFADHHNMPVFETSAKDDSEVNHVEAIFVTLALKLKRERPFLPFTSISSEDLTRTNENSISLHNSQIQSDESSCFC